MSKPIYIGDKINLKIDNTTQDELQNAFKDFHIDKAQDEKITFRSFKVGDNIVDLKNNEINLKITSTLSPEDKNIFLNLSNGKDQLVKNPSFPFIFLLGIFIFIISFVGLIKNLIKKSKLKNNISPKERCKNILENLDDRNFPFEISTALREYIDYLYNTKFLSGDYSEINSISSSDIEFLYSLDFYKFSNKQSDDKIKLQKRGFEIFNKLKEEDKDV